MQGQLRESHTKPYTIGNSKESTSGRRKITPVGKTEVQEDTRNKETREYVDKFKWTRTVSGNENNVL